MAKKKAPKRKSADLSSLGGMIYSTDPGYSFEEESQEDEVISPQKMLLYVSRDKKSRGGKVATLVEGFEGTEDDLASLGKLLKQRCGVGGNTKDGLIIIQGDKRDQVVAMLEEKGYKVKRKGG